METGLIFCSRFTMEMIGNKKVRRLEVKKMRSQNILKPIAKRSDFPASQLYSFSAIQPIHDLTKSEDWRQKTEDGGKRAKDDGR